MNPILNKNIFLVKEKIGIFKASNNYDVYSPQNNELILNCREINLGFFSKILRFTDYKRMTPFEIEIKTPTGEKLLSVKRGVTFFRSDVEVFDEKERLIGLFKQKFWSFGGKFEIEDQNGKSVCTLQGKWTGWDFKFVKDTKEIASVSKKWTGIGKEFFTSADNYVLEISPNVPKDDVVRQLVMAAIMCIDMVLKE
jgi:uncharacterized protein YxjI